MIKSVLKFLLILTALMVVSFALHVFILHLNSLPVFGNNIIGCYVFNHLIAAVTFFGLLFFKEQLSSSLGFIFMGGSMVKFGLFFLIFYPSFNQDGEISKIEFAAFFIPYAISLIVEVIFLSKTLNK